MEHQIKTSWRGGMKVEAETESGSVDLDASVEWGGNDDGLRSKPLMLVSLAGCTSVDVLSILKKMQIEIEDFSVEVRAKLGEGHPAMYIETHIIYCFRGESLDKKRLERAVELSFDSYCGVIAMFKKFSTLSKEIRYL
jgi:putative redox protein